jgi:hypothetical protein
MGLNFTMTMGWDMWPLVSCSSMKLH